MVAKSKRTRKPVNEATEDIVDIQDIFALHVEGSRRFDELIAEGHAFQAIGKSAEARERLNTAEEIRRRLRALEEGCRAPNKSRDKRFTKDE